MNYKQALDWVHGLPRLARMPGIDRMRKLMAALGNPQRRLPFVHIVGTNGKGSATVMLASVLKSAGYKTGTNISPFVLDFRERFQINGKMIEQQALAKILSIVKVACETLPQLPIEFEAVSAAALLWFAQEGCDIACVEAGIGGRFDATNVIEGTEVVCVMKIGFDHTELLGNTLAQIAAEKCAVFKNGCAVISYPQQPAEAAAVIMQAAKREKCSYVSPLIKEIHIKKVKGFENFVTYKGNELEIPFPGTHQAGNAAVVVEAALALRETGMSISRHNIEEGIALASIPARIEVLQKKPLLIIDGAHNEDSALALAETLRAAGVNNLMAIVGVLADKQVKSILKCIAPYINTLFAVEPNNPRALPAAELAALAAPIIENVVVCKDVYDGILRAKKAGGNGIIVCGSLYLVSQVRSYFVN